MKWLAGILAVVVIVLAVAFVNYKKQTEKQLFTTRQELTDKEKQLALARSEVAEVKAEMEKNFGVLETKVETLIKDKIISEEKLAALTDDMRAVLDDLQVEKDTRRKVEQKNMELASSLDGVNDELGLLRKNHMQLQQDFSTLESTHDKTMEQFTAMREDYVVLTKQNEEMDAMLHDLKALRAQIRTVKIELHKEHVEDWKRRDRAEASTGNSGFLLKSGEWQTTPEDTSASKFPLNEDIRRD